MEGLVHDSGTGLADMPPAPHDADGAQPPQLYDAVIVGAGFAGLVAARLLGVYGLRALVLEARDRIGGRAHTMDFPALPELGLMAAPVEAGCNYLHGCAEGHTLFALARRLGIPSAVCASDLGGRHGGWESVEVADWRDPECGGAPIPLKEVMAAVFLVEQTVHGVGVFARPPGNEPLPESSSSEDESEGTENGEAACDQEPMPEPPEDFPPDFHTAFEHVLVTVLKAHVRAGRRGTAELTSRERGLVRSIRGRLFGYVSPLRRMPAWLATRCLGGRARCWKVFRDPHWPLSQPGLIEGLTWIVQEKLDLVKGLGFAGPDVEVCKFATREDRLLLGSGFGGLIQFLAAGVEVLKQSVVKRIAQEPEHVEVQASGRTFRARFVVVTVPCGVLAGLDERSSITFEPPLGAEKLQAIRNLSIPEAGSSTHEKVVLRWEPSAHFVRHVLGSEGAPLQLATTDPRFHFLNLHKYGREGQVLCHIWGDAEWAEHGELDDAGVVAEVVAALRAAFPASWGAGADEALVTEPRQAHVTRWARDPFTLGAYSELQTPHASERDRDLYARAVGRVFFSGEGAVPGPEGAQCTHGAFVGGVHAALQVLCCWHRELGHTGNFPGKALLREKRGRLDLDVEKLMDLLTASPPDERRERQRSGEASAPGTGQCKRRRRSQASDSAGGSEEGEVPVQQLILGGAGICTQ